MATTTKAKGQDLTAKEQELIAQAEANLVEQEAEEGNIDTKDAKIDYALNRLRGEQEISGKAHWANFAGYVDKNKSLYELVQPDAKMVDPYYRAYAYLNETDGTKVEVEFDRDYLSAWLNYHLIGNCKLKTDDIESLIDDIAKLEELELQKQIESEAMTIAQNMHKTKGSKSKGVEYYFQQIMSMQ